MQCRAEVALPRTGQSLDERLNAIAAALQHSDAVLVRRQGAEVSFVSCALQLGPNSAVMLGPGQLVLKDEGASPGATLVVDLPLVDNALFGGLFSLVLAALVLSSGTGWLVAAGAFLAGLAAYVAWIRGVALDWMASIAQGSAASAMR